MFRKYRVIALLLVGLVLSPTAACSQDSNFEPSTEAACQRDLDKFRNKISTAEQEHGTGSPEHLEAIEQGLKKFPNSLQLIGHRRNAYWQSGKYSLALKDSELIISLKPGTAGWEHFMRAQILWKLKRYREVVKECDIFLGSNPVFERLDALFLKSVALSKLGKTSDARRTFDLGFYIAEMEGKKHTRYFWEAASSLHLIDKKGDANRKPRALDTALLKIPAPVPHRQNVEPLLLDVLRLAYKGAPNTVLVLEKELGFDAKVVNTLIGQSVIGSNQMWKRIQFDSNKALGLCTLRLEPDVVFAAVYADDITKVFGPARKKSSIRMSHGDMSALDYRFGSCQVNFSFLRGGYYDIAETKTLASITFSYPDETTTRHYPSQLSSKLIGSKAPDVVFSQ